ncbi:MAG TPA: tetratricopeptide repeat protein [Gallionella sp.]|nr:tetratricopeptide repeat protein [Gallionella sp.]
MSLLLDAQKKAQQANLSQPADASRSGRELSLEPHPGSASQPAASEPVSSSGGSARATGQNLFNAKSRVRSSAPSGINRNWLIALGGVVILLAAGAGYVWYAISPGNAQRPVLKPLIASAEKPAAPTQPQNSLAPNVPSAGTIKPATIPKPAHARTSAKMRPTQKSGPVVIEQRQEEPIDPILSDAYLAYRSGNLDQAQQLYVRALNLDANNSDALLGLAAIAQRRGDDKIAAHYYARVLSLDPRNAVANAGMSELTTDDNRESRLKLLLNEQQDSSTLHFALGNYYAEQSRWGEAQQAYFDAYKLAPGNAELAFNLAVSLDRLGQNKQAAQYYQRALLLDPNQHAGFDHAKITQRIKDITH